MTEPRVIAETETAWVIDKPPRWLSVPSSRPAEDRPVILNWARERLGEAYAVHRLDFETSGVMILAKTKESERELAQAFESREMRKTYAFLAQGRPKAPSFKCAAAIEEKPSETRFSVRKRFEGFFFGEASPLTGRRHQIRIHLKNLGHPILGDREYGGWLEIESPAQPGGKTGIPRLCLHAERLRLPNGATFESPLPPLFDGLMKEPA